MKQPVKVLNMNLGKRQKIQQANSTILLVVGIASIIISFALVSGNFLWKQKSYNDRVYTEKKKARDTIRQNVVNAKDLLQGFEDLESPNSIANSATILDALPGDYDNPALRTAVESLVKRNSLTLDSLASADEEGQVKESSIGPKPVEMPYSITVVGSYDKIRSFVTDLERSIRQMKVKSMILSGSDQDMKADLDVITYFQPTHTVGVETKEVR